MGADKYWSVEDCCWVDCPGAAAPELELPQQRAEEPVVVVEPVDA